MILYSKDKDEKNIRKEKIENEKSTIILMIDSQNVKKGILTDTMQRFANYADTVAPKEKNDSIAFFLNNFKNSLAIANTNIFLLNNLLGLLDELLNIKDNKDDKEFFEKLDKYNVSFGEANDIILNNTIQIEQTLSHILSFSEFAFDSKNKLNDLITNIANKNLVNLNAEGNTTSINVESISEVVINESLIQEFDKEEHPENTLVVSEKEGIVLLPFTLREINTIYNENRDKYASFKQIIEEKYTVKFDEYRNPALASFREAFKLMRIKEKASIIKAFELGMELFFNYNLHPAIISACKSLDELDIYLDYLEDNETHKFDCFKIIFDMAPIEVKSNKLFNKKNKKDNQADKETVEEILAVELESQTLDLEDIKEEIETEKDKKKDKIKEEKKKSFDIDLNSSSMDISKLEKVLSDEIQVVVIPNRTSKSKGKSKLRRNEDYNLYENMMEETTKKVDIPDSKFKDVNDTISIVEDFMSESTLEMPELNKIVVPKEVKKKRVTKTNAKVKVSKDSKKDIKVDVKKETKTENKTENKIENKTKKTEVKKEEKTVKPETKKVTKKVTKTKDKDEDKNDNKVSKEEKNVKTTKTKKVVRKKVSKDA